MSYRNTKKRVVLNPSDGEGFLEEKLLWHIFKEPEGVKSHPGGCKSIKVAGGALGIFKELSGDRLAAQ